jgi:hypothetical protein
MAERLKDDLGLTDDQVAKIEKIEDALHAEMDKARDQEGDGEPDFAKMREKFDAMRKKMQEQIGAVLTPEQKTKFDAMEKERDERFQGRGPGGPGGPGGGPGGPGRRGPSSEELLARAEKALNLSADEKSVVLPLVKNVIDAKSAARQQNQRRRQELGKFLGEPTHAADAPAGKEATGTTDAHRDEIVQRLKDVRKAAAADQAKVKEAEGALRDVLTAENEARLVALEILD